MKKSVELIVLDARRPPIGDLITKDATAANARRFAFQVARPTDNPTYGQNPQEMTTTGIDPSQIIQDIVNNILNAGNTTVPCPPGNPSDCTSGCTGGCVDDFQRPASGTFGVSGIECINWQASTDGTRMVDSLHGGVQSTAGGQPADWLTLTYNGSTVEILAKMQLPNSGSGTWGIMQQTGVAANGPTHPASPTPLIAWGFGKGTGTTINLSVFASDAVGSTASGVLNSHDIGITTGNSFWLRMRLSESSIQMSSWKDGDIDPGTWDLTASTTANFLTNGITQCNCVVLTRGPSNTGDMYVGYLSFISGIDCTGGVGTVPDCTGQTITAQAVLSGSVYALPSHASYIIDVYFDSIVARRDIDYTVSGDSISPTNPLSSSVVVTVKYVVA